VDKPTGEKGEYALADGEHGLGKELQELQEFRSYRMGIELIPSNEVFSSIFCLMVGFDGSGVGN
jgi:hypothetical protein